MISADMHVHTIYSCDSKTTIEEYCEMALRPPTVDCICFTDHVDNNRRDIGCDYYCCEGFFESLDAARQKYGDRIRLLAGIEFAEPHLYRKELERLSCLPYDFILGSIHFWYNDLFASEMLGISLSLEDSYKYYWEEVAEAVRAGGFDSLAHMDFPKRYYMKLMYDNDVVSDIFKEMVKNGITLEINTSSLRKGLDETMPGSGMLELYRKAGGSFTTLGSDAHCAEDMRAGFDTALSAAHGLQPVIYVDRKMIVL